MRCLNCPRNCERHSPVGFCGATEIVRCFRHRVEYSEEAEISPSHLFYLSGCNLRCDFCIGGRSAIDPNIGHPLSQTFFEQAIAWGRLRHAKNIQWVGGEPGIHLPYLLELMDGTPQLPPVVWKSNFYFSPVTFEMLWDYIDVFVADLKFGNNACALAHCGVNDYLDVVGQALRTVYQRDPRKLIVRHLLLPGHFQCCFLPVVDWFVRNIPEALFSLRDGYVPTGKAKADARLCHWLSADDAKEAKKIVLERCQRVA